jgi:RNA polymerase sigma factor (TIGR02999 family)
LSYATEVQSEAGPGEITVLLRRWEQGDPGSLDQLAPLVYDQLRAIADAYLRNERPEHTLQPTAVVHEVFVDLLQLRRVGLKDRAHFYAFAAKLARRILIDHARNANARKRGPEFQRIPLDAELGLAMGRAAGADETLDLGVALDELAALDPFKTRAVELRYFLGCTVEETADLLQIPKRTLERSLEFSLAWLRKRLGVRALTS